MNPELKAALQTLLKEAYEGTDTSFFSDSEKGGLLGTLDELSAEKASQVPSGDTTVAAHAEHLRWSLANLNGTMRGAAWNPNWGESWRVRSVDEAQWNAIRADLRREYETLRDSIPAMPETLEPIVLNGALATLAHAAYHLGAVRQMVKALS